MARDDSNEGSASCGDGGSWEGSAGYVTAVEICGKPRIEQTGIGNAKFGMKESEKEGMPARDSKIYATMGIMVAILEYRESDGCIPFREWTDALDAASAQRVARALYRLGQGNFSNVKSVGAGILECKIHFGPGYRIYFGKDGEEIVVLLGGGTKQRQQNDILRALNRWHDYKQRKAQRKEGE